MCVVQARKVTGCPPLSFSAYSLEAGLSEFELVFLDEAGRQQVPAGGGMLEVCPGCPVCQVSA